MNTELNNAIVKNKKVYAENEEATHTNIKTLDDVIAAMNRINAKYDKPARIKTVDDNKNTYKAYQNVIDTLESKYGEVMSK